MNTAKHVYRIIFSFVPELECMEERGKKKNTKKNESKRSAKNFLMWNFRAASWDNFKMNYW